ncbi:MAG: hypothetical protein WA988_14775 [Candidatus Nanopelagicales bacterium]
MLNPTKGANWLSRAFVLGSTCVAITLVAHATAGGTVPIVGVAFVTVLMLLGALLATSRELSLPSMLAFLAGSQVVCHLLLNGFGHSEVAGSAATSSERGSHAMHDVTATSPEAIATAAEAHSMTLSMVLAHVVACVAAALVLREGERVMFSLHRALPNIVRVLFGLVVGRPTATPVANTGVARPIADSTPRLSILDFASELSRRGPPSLPVACCVA